jgi:hypothetical protein
MKGRSRSIKSLEKQMDYSSLQVGASTTVPDSRLPADKSVSVQRIRPIANTFEYEAKVVPVRSVNHTITETPIVFGATPEEAIDAAVEAFLN